MYLQINQAAERLEVTRQWIHVLINRGDIGTSEIAGRRFVLDDDRFKALCKQKRKRIAKPRNGAAK